MSALGVTVQGVDADPVTAAIADVNLRHWPDSRARVGLAEEFEAPRDPLRSRVGVWLDPARRMPGGPARHGRIKRVFRLDEIPPTWEFVLQVATAVPATGAKLSPSMPHDAIPHGTEAQWTSFAGEVLECAVWWGPLAAAPGRSARSSARAARRSRSTRRWPSRRSRPPSRWRRGAVALRARPRGDPGRAAGRGDRGDARQRGRLRAGLRRQRAQRRRAVRPPLRRARGDAVQRQVAARLAQQHGITGLTIKKRGVRLDDEELRRQLRIGRKAGDGAQATVILTRVAGQQVVLVVDPA